MSGFFKGIFRGGEEQRQHEAQIVPTEELESQELSDDDIEQLEADVKGTVDTEIPQQLLTREPETHTANRRSNNNVWARRPVDPVEHRDFYAEDVWNNSGVSKRDQETVSKAQHLLKSLPESTPNAVKRQIVEASLKAFEVSIDEITAGATDEIAALRDYIDTENETAENFTADSEARIATLEAEIEDIRATIRDANDQRERLVGQATEVINLVTPVLEFFNPSYNTSTNEPVVKETTFTVTNDTDTDDDVDSENALAD